MHRKYHKNPTGTPFPHRNPPPCGQELSQEPPLFVQEDPSWTLPGPFLDPFLHKNPLPAPLPRHFLHRNRPPSCTWCFGVLPHRLPRSSETPLSHRGIATTQAMQLRPCSESLGISVVPPRVKLCEAPCSWHHFTRPAHDVTTILRDCRAQTKIRVRYALGLRQKGLWVIRVMG